MSRSTPVAHHPLAGIAVAGAAATRQARRLDSTSAQVCLEAAQAALDDAGMDIADVDGISARWPGSGGTVLHPGSVDWAALFGKGFDWVGDTYPQGAPGLLDLCLASEGAAAVVVTSLERARDCPSAPAVLLGGGSEWQRQQYVDPPRYDDVARIGADAYRRTFAMAGLRPDDVDVFELYDINTFEVVRQFETLGFCAEGEGVDYLAEAGIGAGGRHPTNTDGGLMAYSHVGFGGPTLKIVEAVRQTRGTAGVSQVPGAESVLVTGAGSGAQYHNAVLLGADR